MNTKPKYFLYARKSTEEDDRQVMSIEAQLFELREYARRENLEIVSEYQESRSAKTPGRPIFAELMKRVESMDGVGILAWHPDRLARNSIDGGRIIYAVDTQKIVALRFSTFWFEPTPQGLFMLQVAFGQSKYYSDNLSENIKRGVRQKLRRKEWLGPAPFGYQNNPRTRNIEPHPTESRIVRVAFEEYAKGGHSLVSLSQFLFDLGVQSKHGTPLVRASIKRMLSHRAYIGFLKHKGEWFEGSFDSIVSPVLFEAVQKILQMRERPRHRRARHDFPFTGLFRCAECGSMISAQWATGKSGIRYRYYRCSKKHGRCSQSYIQESDLADRIRIRLQAISLPSRYTDYMTQVLQEWEREEVSASRSGVQNLSDKIQAAEERVSKLVSAYLDGDIPKDAYLAEKDTSMRSLAALRDNMKDFERGGKQWVELLREWVLDLKQADFLSSSDDLPAIKAFVRKIGTNPSVRDKSPRFSVSAPFDFVAQRREFLPDPTLTPRSGAALAESECIVLRRRWDSNPRCLATRRFSRPLH